MKSCCKKDQPKLCKGGFPLVDEMTDRALIVCPCIAHEKSLCRSGPRSLLGGTLPARNDPWVNAGPTAWLVFSGDNGDIKFPHKMPIVPETHEKMKLFDVKRRPCCSSDLSLQMTYDMQAGQAVAAGYFGGYSAKMQDVGHKELQRLEQALRRKVDAEAQGPAAKAFQRYFSTLAEGPGIQRYHPHLSGESELIASRGPRGRSQRRVCAHISHGDFPSHASTATRGGGDIEGAGKICDCSRLPW